MNFLKIIPTLAMLVIANALFSYSAQSEEMKFLNISKNISAEFPFQSKYLEVLDSKLHYVESGEGDPILFLHGNPTSSYLWRNIIPYAAKKGRAIAIDLIGMGKSGKPDIEYSFEDHAKYLNAFIEKMQLENITLVIHDWGSGLGFNYAATHENNVKGIVFMEALLRPFEWNTLPNEDSANMLKNIRNAIMGKKMLMEQNFFIEKFLPSAVVRKLSKEELDHYRQPFKTIESRLPIWRWPSEIPIAGEPENVYQVVENYYQWLQETDTPMLGLYATPGLMIQQPQVKWIQENIKNATTAPIGKGLHFVQEDNPDVIGKELVKWYQTL